MFPRLRRQLCALALLAFSSVAFADCPYGTMYVQEWNHFLDGTISDINGCVIRVKEPLSELGPEDQQGNVIPKADTPIPDTPAGWTDPVPPATQPTPPSTTTASYTWDAPASSCRGFSTHTDAANCQLGFYPGANITSSTVTATQGGQPAQYIFYLSNGVNFYVGRNLLCPSGYTWNGTVCNMTNPATVMKPVDNKCNIIRTGNTFSGDPKDPDCGAPFYTAGKIEISGNTVKVKTEPSLTVKANTDGSTTISTTTINNTTNTTTISTANYNNAGLQTGRKTETFNGVGDSQNQVSNDQPFDVSSLNKEATQQAIKSNLDTIKDELNCDDCTQLPADLTDQQRTQIEDEIKKTTDSLAEAENDYLNYKTYFDWPTWIPTFPTDSCTPFTKTIHGLPVEIDLCPKIALLNELIGWLMSLFTAWTVVSMFFGGRNE